MMGTSVIQTSLESCNSCDDQISRNGYQQTNGEQKRQSIQSQVNNNNNKTKGNSSVRLVSIKENKNLSRSLDKCDIGPPAKRRLFDENDLKDLLKSFENCPYYKDNLETLTSHSENYSAKYSSTRQQEYWDQFYSFPRLFTRDHNASNGQSGQPEPFVLQPSLFHLNKVPPTIYFKTKLTEDSKPPIGLPKILQQLFKWKISAITPNTIRNCILFMKFDIIRPSNTTDNSFLGTWCKHMPTADFGQIEEWRKVNHYPGSFHMGRKDKLWLRLRIASQRHETFGTFHPMTFVLPKDYDELNRYWKNSPSNLFIMKPPASARGNGVKVINDITQIPESALRLPESADGIVTKKSTIIVQQYISNPCLLANGQKFDLRIYVLITSVDPLRIYVYEEGLVRFASSKYSCQEDGIIDQYMHLTNYFVNKNNQEYKINNDCESLQGCKWTLTRFWRYLEEHHQQVNTKHLWNEIIDIIVKTIICCETPMTRLSHQNCKNDYTSYELFGFDIFLDANFKPWILEVNITPSLKSESNLDTSVKFRVIKDMFNLVGYHLPPPTTNSTEKKPISHLEDCNLFFNSQLYTEDLSKSDKLKHLKYQKLYKSESNGTMPEQTLSEEDSQGSNGTLSTGDSLLNDLLQSDIRVLMLAEDELSRCGQFKRAFPSATSSPYLEYFDKPRYYNLLLDAWEQKYKDNRRAGIQHLSKFAKFLD